jgi:hypothetical protein
VPKVQWLARVLARGTGGRGTRLGATPALLAAILGAGAVAALGLTLVDPSVNAGASSPY